MITLDIIMCNPSPRPFCRGRGGEPPTKFSKKGGLTGPQLLEGGCWEREGAFFQGGCNFHINKLKSEIFNDKKVYKEKYFSVITKNSN